MAEEAKRISPSSYDAFRTCPRMYFWRHVARLARVRQDGARRFGTLYHAALEAWWRASDGGFVPWNDRDASLVAALGALATESKHIDTDPFEVARAEAVVVAYHARYFELDFDTPERIKGGGAEIFFDLPLVDGSGKELPGWRLVGKRDAIKRFASDGRTRVCEHKSTSNDIDGASDYWARLKIDLQVSIYVDAARRLGEADVSEALYDVAHRPAQRPKQATPEEDREYTKGKGCRYCGGRAGGKLGVAQGTGKIMVRTRVDADGQLLPAPVDVETTCTHCDGSGWQPDAAPKLHKTMRTDDETPYDFKHRIADAIAAAPDDHFRQGIVTRSDDQLAEAREDLVMTAAEIGGFVELAKIRSGGDVSRAEARRCFPRSSSACVSIYGRRCDYIDVCSGAVDPYQSTLYRISSRKAAP